MSVFMDLLCEMLPLRSSLQDDGNPLRVVLDKSVCEWMDNHSHPFDELFLTTAEGGWLDAHGKDYGVPRKLDETDDDYRQRIIYETLEELTAPMLKEMYDVDLYSYVTSFNVTDNRLVSDNSWITNAQYIGYADENTQRVLQNKFIVDNNILWITNGAIDYIINTSDADVLLQYKQIYSLTNCYNFFGWNTSLGRVKLFLPYATNCRKMFWCCTGLTSVSLDLPVVTNCWEMLAGCESLTSVSLDLPVANNCASMLNGCLYLTSVSLDLPSATDCQNMLMDCVSLTSVTLNLPSVTTYLNIFKNCTLLEYINLTIPTNKVAGMLGYITGLNLQYLTTLIINGRRYVLS